MKYKLVYSQVPACSYGNSVTNTLECASCDMVHIGSNMKMYVPEDQPVPEKAVVDKEAAFPGDTIKVEVDYSAPVKAEDVKVIVGELLEVVNVTATPAANQMGRAASGEGTHVVVECKIVEGAKGGRNNIIVSYKNVDRMFSVKVNIPNSEDDKREMELASITLDKSTIEVGEIAKATLNFKEKVSE